MLDRAVDSSFDELTVQEAECFRNTGWPLYIQCLWTAAVQPSPRITSLRNADSVGLPFGTYISLNRYRDGGWHVDQARAGVPDDLWAKQLFTAIDIELDGIQVTEILRAIERAEELLVHPWQQVLLYTNYNSWMTKIIPRNSTAVADRGNLLWNANWDEDPDIDFPWRRFGGWHDDQVAIEQYTGGRFTCGQFADRNIFVRELIFLQEGGEVDEVAREQIQKLSKEHEALGAVQLAAGLFLEIEAKLALHINIPVRTRDQVRWMLGGVTPNIKTTSEALQVLYSYAAGCALTGKSIDVETQWRMRHALL